MAKYKVSELEGDDLDAAVALARGRLLLVDEPGWKTTGDLAKLMAEWLLCAKASVQSSSDQAL